jgi:hypothetical protein
VIADRSLSRSGHFIPVSVSRFTRDTPIFCVIVMTIVILCCRDSQTRKKMLHPAIGVARRSHSPMKLRASRQRHAAQRLSRYHFL